MWIKESSFAFVGWSSPQKLVTVGLKLTSETAGSESLLLEMIMKNSNVQDGGYINTSLSFNRDWLV